MLLACGAVLSVIEAGAMYKFTGDDRELYLGTLMMVVAIFIMSMKYPERVKSNVLVALARRDAQNVYLVHLWVIDALNMIIAGAGFAFPFTAWIKPFVVMAVSVLISALLRICRERFATKHTA